jgi:hypothetical protein
VILGFLSSYLIPYRILMVWVYDRTGSLLVAILVHASLIASSISGFGLVPPSISGVPFLIMFFAFTGLLWLTVAAVTVAHRGHSSPNARPRRWSICNPRHMAGRAVGPDDSHLRRPTRGYG